MSLSDQIPSVSPDASGEKSAASEVAKMKQLTTAAKIENALSFLRSTARTNDYFTGYSLAEIIKERIDLIGEVNDEVGAKVGDSQKSTLISELNELLIEVVGEFPKHEGGVIAEALNLEKIEDLGEEEEYEVIHD